MGSTRPIGKKDALDYLIFKIYSVPNTMYNLFQEPNLTSQKHLFHNNNMPKGIITCMKKTGNAEQRIKIHLLFQ